MAKLIHMKKKPAKGYSAGLHSGQSAARGVSAVQRMRGRRPKGLWAFIRRNYKLLSIGAAGVVAGIVCLIIFVGSADKPASVETAGAPVAETATPTQSILPVAEGNYDYSSVDESVLAGLTGTDDSLFTDDEEMADALFTEEGLRIGVTVGSLDSSENEQILSRLEETANIVEGQKLVYEVYYYNANGNYNQQVQDVRSLIKNQVDAIIVGFSDETRFNMVSMMAKEQNIPVVAIDAPAELGCSVNIVADNQTWGETYGTFLAQNLIAGNIAAIFDNKDDPADSTRLSEALGAVAENQSLTVTGTAYAAGNKADSKAAMAALLKAGQVDGVITEDGMAEGILDAYIEAGTLPKVMCGDVTAGFIKKWYALKNGGLSVAPKTDGKKDDDEPAPTPVLLLAQPDEMVVCAQPSTAGVGAAAFEFALKLAEGRKLKQEGMAFEYQVNVLVTDDNLDTYYEQIKDKDDDFTIRDFIVTSEIDELFEAAEAAETE